MYLSKLASCTLHGNKLVVRSPEGVFLKKASYKAPYFGPTFLISIGVSVILSTLTRTRRMRVYAGMCAEGRGRGGGAKNISVCIPGVYYLHF